MSSGVRGWVENDERCRARGLDKWVLSLIADHCGNRPGIDPAYTWPGIACLAQAAGVERKTVMECIKRLERDGELLVRRPVDRGSGKHNEYVVVMGRDPAELATKLGWVNRSVPRTNAEAGASDAAPTANAPSGTEDPHRGVLKGHRATKAAPTATAVPTATVPVDIERGPITESVRRTDQSSTDRSRTGPGPVRLAGPEFRSPEVPNPSQRALAHQTQPGHARETVSVVDNGFVDALREALVGLAPDITFDLPEARVIQLLEHAAAWPDRDGAIAAFVAVSNELAGEYGAPRSARAWVPGWLATTPPPVTADEPMCDEHPLGDIPVPKRACAACRTSLVGQQAEPR